MIIIILTLFPLLLTYSIYSYSHIYHLVDNSVNSLNNTLPRNWIILDEKEPLKRPMFDTKIVEESTINHMKSNLKNHLKQIKIGFYYFDEESLIESKEKYVTGVRLSFRCSIPFSKDYYRAIDYAVSKVK